MALCDPLSHQRRNPPPLLPGKTNLQSARLRRCLPAVCDAAPPLALLFIYDPWPSNEGHYERDYTAKRLGSDPTLITHSLSWKIGEDSGKSERCVGLFDHSLNQTYMVSPGEEVRLSRDTLKCAVLWGLLSRRRL